MPLALAPETVSSFALLALSVVVLAGGVAVARWLGGAPNRVIRVAFPLIAISTLAAFALLVYVARLTR